MTDGTTLTADPGGILCVGRGEVSPTVLRLPVQSAGDWEAVEGMLVRFDEPLVVTDAYDLWRYGELILADERLMIPTSTVAPGVGALDVSADNALRRIILDDGSTTENPVPIPYPSGGMTAEHSVAAGDQVLDIEGVVDQSGGAYRIQPTRAPRFVVEERLDVPEVEGRLRVVMFNVENYFNGDGAGAGFPTTRGAATVTEYARQEAKVAAALDSLDADVFALAEIENDGYGPKSAVATLVSALNERSDRTYTFVDPERDRLGDDEIAVAILYDTNTVCPIGVARAPDSFCAMNRFPLAQMFEEVATGERLTVVVNHLKSRSSSRASGANRDQGDGQGCWNANRSEAIDDLIAWLEEADLRTADANLLMVGDLNAYTMEDPLTALRSEGFVNLVDRYVGAGAYTYVYDGESGTIDHALAAGPLASQIADVAIWHINADASSALGYMTRYKTEESIRDLYLPDAVRSSDHDPVIVGIDLGEVGDNGP